VREGGEEVPIGESLDNGDARGRQFSLFCGVVLPPFLMSFSGGENPILSWMCDDDAFGIVPLLKASHLDIVFASMFAVFGVRPSFLGSCLACGDRSL